MDPQRRLALGQWFTPPAVADLALALALPADRSRARVLDPACGDGAFLARAIAGGVAVDRLTGIEIDPATAAAARDRVPGGVIERRDFFAGPPLAGLDAVVGNPPYVRAERRTPAARQAVRAALAAAYPDAPATLVARLVGRGDLAAAFVAAGLAAVRPGGRVALVVSSALLDAGYADALWRLIEPLGGVIALVEAPGERWFADAAVNPMILVLERGARGRPVTIARLRCATAEAAARVTGVADLAEVADCRTAAGDRPDQWASRLRAPPLWFELAARLGDALCPLGDLAEVRRGITSGANHIFYLSRARAAELGLEPELLAPLVRSPRRGGDRIALAADDTVDVVLVAPPGRAELARYPRARRYLDGFAAAAAAPTLAARPAWWSLPVRPARVFLTKAYHARFAQRLASRPVVADQRLYALTPREVDPVLLAAALNGSLAALALESLGRASLGEGALEWTVADAARLPVLDPRRLDDAGRRAVLVAFAAMCTRPIGLVEQEASMGDRAALDRALAPSIADALPALHAALIDRVAARTTRASRPPP